MNVKKTIDVRGKSVQERQQMAKKESMALKPGEVIEIIADDERMPALAPKMAQAIGTIEAIEVTKKDDGLYHGYFRRIELLPLIEAEKGALIKIARIDGGAQVAQELKKHGISVETVAEVLEKKVSHIHSGPLIVKTNGKESLVPRGIAEKILVGDRKLLEMESGEKGIITNLQDLNDEMAAALSEIGLEEGTGVSVEGHDIEKTYRFNIGGNRFVLGDGEAAKILVQTEKGTVQANFLEGTGTVKSIIGGTEILGRLGGKGIANEKIELVSVEEAKSHEDTGHFITLKVNGKDVVLGKGLSEKVWARK